jgi:pSer/pThr/pTyr-binding forkhead associated (FHA) protein/tetratricopeptide (TPR) repeat protein
MTKLNLCVFKGEDRVSALAVEAGKPVSFGRDEGNTLVLDDDKVSRRHCTVEFKDGAFVLTDLGSSNGTFVGGERVTSRALSGGETIELGGFTIQAQACEDGAPQDAPDAKAEGDADRGDRTMFRAQPVFTGAGDNAVEVFEGPGQGLIRRFGESLLIGRAASCDLVLDDPSISREHARLAAGANGLELTSLVARNLAQVNGKRVAKAPLANGDVIVVGPAKLRLTLRKVTPLSPARRILSRLPMNRKTLTLAGAGVFVLILLIYFFTSPGGDTGGTAQDALRQKEQVQRGQDQANLMATLLTQAKRATEKGDLEQAAARYQSVLDLAPDNAEATAGLKTMREAISKRQAEAKLAEEQAAKSRERISGFIRDADRNLSQGRFREASKNVADALKVSPDSAEARALAAKIEETEAQAKRIAEEKQAAQAQERERLRDLYAQADLAAREDRLYEAMKAYRDAAASDTDQARAAQAKNKAASLQDALVKKIMPEFNQGLKLYGQKKYAEALVSFVNVLAIYPEAKESRAKVAEIRQVLDKDAKRLYEEGLVYEGLGDRAQAKERWQELIDTVPFDDNDYVRKARTKLGQ